MPSPLRRSEVIFSVDCGMVLDEAVGIEGGVSFDSLGLGAMSSETGAGDNSISTGYE